MAPSSRRRAAAVAATAAIEEQKPCADSLERADTPSAAPSSSSSDPTTPSSSPSSPSSPSPSSSPNQRRASLALVAVACLLLLLRLFAGGADAGIDEDAVLDADELEPPAGGLSVKRPAANKDGEAGKLLKVHLEHSGWSPQIGSLVEKRPPRPCAKTEIAAQMFDLLVYRTGGGGKKAGGTRRAFACISSSSKCRDTLVEDAMDRQWKPVKQAGSIDATFVFSDAASLAALPPATFAQLYFAREGSTYLDVVFGGLALNTDSALEQFGELQRYTRQFGCEVNDLHVMLPKFRPHEEKECLDLKHKAETASRSQYIVGTSAMIGAGEVLTRLGDCTATLKPELIQSPLGKPMLYNGKDKFVVRSFCLLGSTMPFMVFFRRGFVVLDGSSNSKNNKHVSLEQFQRTLANSKITGTHFIDTFLQTSMKQIALYVFQASRQSLLRRRGSFQLFSLDFVVSEEMKIYLHSTSAHPSAVPQNIVTDMLDLVMELGEEPGAFSRMLPGDKYGSFELIFSELRETCEGASSFNPCQQFKQYNTQNLAKANKKISVTHNAFNREHHEETRVVKKLEEEKKKLCKEKGFSLESKSCDKYAKMREDEEFEVLFAQHEKDWNPNAFKLAQPGEVFPWEIV